MMERPEKDAPRLAWMLYVFERVAPILTMRDAAFAAVVKRDALVVQAAEALLNGGNEGLVKSIDPAWCERVLATLVARAQAVFETTAYAGSGDERLIKAVADVFLPHSIFGRGPKLSRLWWDHGVEMRGEGDAYFAPGGENYEAAYIDECNRRRHGPGWLERIWKEVREGPDVTSIQRAAGIGLFQSAPDDSEPTDDEQWADSRGIMRGAGIGVFQSGVPGTPEKPPEDKQP